MKATMTHSETIYMFSAEDLQEHFAKAIGCNAAQVSIDIEFDSHVITRFLSLKITVQENK